MKLCQSSILIGVLATSLAAPTASAGELRLEIYAGSVTLFARDVPVKRILDEWARVGRTSVTITGDGLPPGPVTLELTSVPEPLALEVIMRSASGYVAVRRGTENPGVSLYDRILVLSSSVVTLPQHRPTPLTPDQSQSAAEVPTVAGPAPSEVELERVQEDEDDGAQALPSGNAPETAHPARGISPGPTIPAGSPAGTSRVPGFFPAAPEPPPDLMPD